METKLKLIREACIKANPPTHKVSDGTKYTVGKSIVDYDKIPIRLADVLVALDQKYPGQFAVVTETEKGMVVKKEFMEILRFWEWKDNNLENQSEECINFLYELLK